MSTSIYTGLITTQVDDFSDSDLVYVGYCKPETDLAVSDEKFLITRYKISTGELYFADGSTQANKAWSLRDTYTYKLPE